MENTYNLIRPNIANSKPYMCVWILAISKTKKPLERVALYDDGEYLGSVLLPSPIRLTLRYECPMIAPGIRNHIMQRTFSHNGDETSYNYNSGALYSLPLSNFPFKNKKGYHLSIVALWYNTKKYLGSVLLSHATNHIVPLAMRVLTSVFGMGTGISPSL